MKKIACIGKRQITYEEGAVLEDIGKLVVISDCILASGNAEGSDQAYARGGNIVDPGRVHLYLPWYNSHRSAIVEGNETFLPVAASEDTRQLAIRCHPAWAHFTATVKDLMVRNAMIVEGSALVIAFPSRKAGGGGTGHGMRVAEHLMIPRLDLTSMDRSLWKSAVLEKLAI